MVTKIEVADQPAFKETSRIKKQGKAGILDGAELSDDEDDNESEEEQPTQAAAEESKAAPKKEAVKEKSKKDKKKQELEDLDSILNDLGVKKEETKAEPAKKE